MGNFILGSIAVAVIYTFFPALAVKPSNWLRSAWAWLKGKIGPDSTGG